MKTKLFLFVLLMAGILGSWRPSRARADRVAQERLKGARELFIEVNVALAEGRYEEAYNAAERLVHEHAGDYQIDAYTRVYAHTFQLLDEDFRKGLFRPTPAGIVSRLDGLKRKAEKSIEDLVILACLDKKDSESFSIAHLEEILRASGEAAWRDWAEWKVVEGSLGGSLGEKEEKYGPEEGMRLVMSELFRAGMQYLDEHPDSYMVPYVLYGTADWACSMERDNMESTRVAIEHYQRILREYPDAEYFCAWARRDLRRLLGEQYEGIAGESEERDKIITQFYCHSPRLDEYKERTRGYLREVSEGEIEVRTESAEAGLSRDQERRSGAYVVIAAAVGIGVVGVGVILFLRKKLI